MIQTVNICIKLVNWKVVNFEIIIDMNLKFCIDNRLQDCLIWEYNREFYIFSSDTETNNFQNFNKFLENLCLLTYSNTYEMKIEYIDSKKCEELIMILGDINDVDEFIEKNYKNVSNKEYGEKRSEESKYEDSKINNSMNSSSVSQKPISYINFSNNYPNAEVKFKAKVN